VRIEENTFLVAGGGSGLGEATARMLASSGARVVVADLKGKVPEGGRIVETDVTDEVSVRAAVLERLSQRTRRQISP
jgi:NAD(P)-dependent dehydrogenase (short-subunit alcohol dehydrogenase family)